MGRRAAEPRQPLPRTAIRGKSGDLLKRIPKLRKIKPAKGK